MFFAFHVSQVRLPAISKSGVRFVGRNWVVWSVASVAVFFQIVLIGLIELIGSAVDVASPGVIGQGATERSEGNGRPHSR